MSYYDENNLAELVDYYPNEERWYVRNKNLAMACGLKTPLDNSSRLRDIVQMHGLHQHVITVNGESPAKPIVVPFGAEVIMRVHNNLLLEGVTVHVHGMDKRNLWYTDGVGLLQQCPIPVGSTYSYRFIADSPGTLWFHGHFGSDRTEGLLGAFIVTRNDESVVVDAKGTRVLPTRQYVAVLQDWSQTSSHNVRYNQKWKLMKFNYGYEKEDRCWVPTRTFDGTNVGGSVPLHSILINDKGWYNQTELKTVPWLLPLEKYRIKSGENILLRLINGGAGQPLVISIEEHRMTVVAADGEPVKPLTVDFLVLFAGERYDVLIEGKTAPERKTFYIIFETQDYYDWYWKKVRPYYGLAALEYEDNVPSAKNLPDFSHRHCSFENLCMVLNCPFSQYPHDYPYSCISAADLRSLNTANDLSITSDGGFNGGYEEYFLNMHFDSHLNGWQFKHAKGMPYFHHGAENEVATWCDPRKCPSDANRFNDGCKCFFHLNVTLGSIVQMTLYNMGSGSEVGDGYSHPFHIHGTHFYLLKMGYPSYNDTNFVSHPNSDLPCAPPFTESKCNNLKWSNSSWMNGRVAGMNTVDPSYRDSVVIPAGGYIVVRFRAVNPGWWYAHCHIMIHHMGGTAFAIKVGEHDQIPRPPPNFPSSCGVYEQPPLIKL
uniref:Uncharacterized protein n=1 Tax=Plectus sambesii TaxID=2011161 RepID=A0A914UHB2_9BILA